jgi:hypothetical protein
MYAMLAVSEMQRVAPAGEENPMRKHLVAVAFVVLSVAAPARAGIRATYSLPGEPRKVLIVEAADNGDVRAGPVDGDQYLLILGDTAYTVQIKDGKPEVARVADIAAAMDGVVPSFFKQLFSAAASGTPASKLSVTKQGPQTVAGVAGTAYAIKGLDDSQPNKVDTFVFSNDPALAPVGRAIGKFIESTLVLMSGLIGQASVAMIEQERQISALGTLLSGADGPRLEKVEQGIAVDPARLKLPAPPMSVAAISAEFKRSMTAAPQ